MTGQSGTLTIPAGDTSAHLVTFERTLDPTEQLYVGAEDSDESAWLVVEDFTSDGFTVRWNKPRPAARVVQWWTTVPEQPSEEGAA